LGVALAKTAMGGMLGMDVDLNAVRGAYGRKDFDLFSQSAGRLVVSVNPRYQERFEKAMSGNTVARVGAVRGDDRFTISARSGYVVKTSVGDMLEAYKSTFKDY
jgi:phosphoribosylformylglycinamidine synthase